ncbi:MAG: glycosyltransferase family 39 protein [Deltaproteobacteria bacterium]|nr:glycosyltransferase family 39 protein [Deltaproteobacteria bacterium]
MYHSQEHLNSASSVSARSLADFSAVSTPSAAVNGKSAVKEHADSDVPAIKDKPIHRRLWFSCIICALASAVASAAFLPQQSLWTDEAVQLAGLQLNPIEVTQWLSGVAQNDFGIPDDRMPPLSYWVGWGWSRIFGLSERSLRWLSVVATVLATATVCAVAHSVWGFRPAIAGGLLFALSPNVIYQAVEIRAYALLMLAAAGAFACLLKFATTPVADRHARMGWLAGMTGCSILSLYLHFFGVVICGACLLASFIVTWREGAQVLPIVLAGSICVISAIGILPFLKSSISKSAPTPGLSQPSGDVQTTSKAQGLAKLMLRQVCHGAMLGSRPILVVSLVGAGVAGLAALLPGRKAGAGTDALVLAIGSGLLVTGAAYIAQTSFDASSPRYSVWILPGLMLLFGSGVEATSSWPRWLALLGVVLLLIGEAYALTLFVFRGSAFAHTAYGPIEARIHRYGVDRVALVFEGDMNQAVHIYTPARYEFRGKLHQYSYDPEASRTGATRVREALRSQEEPVDPAVLPFELLIVVSPEQVDSLGVVRQLNYGIDTRPDGPVARALLASHGWERVEEDTFLAYVTAHVDVFKRVGDR